MDESTRRAIRSALDNQGFFVSLKPEDLDELTAVCSTQQVPARTVLFKEGDPGDSMFVVVSGQVDIHIGAQDGDVLLSSMGPGDIFGEISVLDGSHRTASATVVADTQLLAIGHEEFQNFLASRPRYLNALLKLLVSRIRNTNLLFPDLGGFNVGASNEGDFTRHAAYLVTIVGYGRYGSLHIGPKYAKDGYPWEVQAIVDPVLNRARLQNSVLGQQRPDIPIFQSIEEWYEGYFKLLNAEERRRLVVEIPLRPGLVYEQTMHYIDAGVKQIILPKPVVMVQEELSLLIEAVAKNEVKAAVASQWHYSDFPRLIRREIARMSGQGDARYPTLHRVEIEFSKENGAVISVTPPLSELPHVLQLLESIDLLDLAQERPRVSGDDTLVDVVYWPEHVGGGVHLRAGLDWKPTPEIKRRYPNWDVQERLLKVYFTEDPSTPGLEVDLWIKFARSGDLAIRPGRMKVRDVDGRGHRESLAMRFVEDQLLHMNEKIFDCFDQEFLAFQEDPRVLSLARYGAIGEQLMQIEADWRQAAAQGVQNAK